MTQLYLPPFDVRAGPYHGLSYHGHSAYSVDFNRGSGNDDLGDWVLASAPGVVTELDWPYGGLKIDHGSGNESWYYHLYSFAVAKGATVAQGEWIGRIGRRYPGALVISPHLHVNHLRDGQRIRVEYGGVPYPASQLDPEGIVVGPLITGQCPYSSGLASR